MPFCLQACIKYEQRLPPYEIPCRSMHEMAHLSRSSHLKYFNPALPSSWIAHIELKHFRYTYICSVRKLIPMLHSSALLWAHMVSKMYCAMLLTTFLSEM